MTKLADYYLYFSGKKIKFGSIAVDAGKDEDDMFPIFMDSNPLVLFQTIHNDFSESTLPEGLDDFLNTLQQNDFNPDNFDGLEDALPELLQDLVTDGFEIHAVFEGQESVLACEEDDEEGFIIGRSSTLTYLDIDID